MVVLVAAWTLEAETARQTGGVGSLDPDLHLVSIVPRNRTVAPLVASMLQ
jgi:hypothetical protein